LKKKNPASRKRWAVCLKPWQWLRLRTVSVSACSLLLTAAAFSAAADETVEFIVKGSYLEKAGLKDGDVVQEVDGKPAEKGVEEQIANELKKQNHVRIKVLRDGKIQILRMREKN
jgi:S1-C subfamily serine protease